MAGAGAISELLGWMLLVFGHTLIITHSKIFAPLRQRFPVDSSPFWGWLFSCPQCMGFWVGIFWATLGVVPFSFSFSFSFSTLLRLLASGCIGSASAYLLAKLLFFLEGPEPPIKIVSAVRQRPHGPMHVRRPPL